MRGRELNTLVRHFVPNRVAVSVLDGVSMHIERGFSPSGSHELLRLENDVGMGNSKDLGRFLRSGELGRSGQCVIGDLCVSNHPAA